MANQGYAFMDSGGGILVANGGSGRATSTAYGVICGGTTATAAQQSIASVGTSGQVLTSNGAGALPTMQDATGGSILLSSMTSAFTSSGTGEQTIHTFSLPANTLGTAGGVKGEFYVTAVGIATNVTFRLKYGSTTVATSAYNQNNGAWDGGVLKFMLLASGATGTQAGVIDSVVRTDTQDSQSMIGNTGAGTAAEDSTGALNLLVTVEGVSGYVVSAGAVYNLG